MSIPQSTLEVIDEMAQVPQDQQVVVAERARTAWDRYLMLLAEDEERASARAAVLKRWQDESAEIGRRSPRNSGGI